MQYREQLDDEYVSRRKGNLVSSERTLQRGDGLEDLDEWVEALELRGQDNEGSEEQEKELSLGIVIGRYGALSKFKNIVLTPAFNWFLNTHVSTIASTYTTYQDLQGLSPGPIVRKIKNLFINAFPFDGLDVGNNVVTAADGKTASRYCISVPWSVYILAFLGLPSRVETIEDEAAKFSFLQFLRNLVGGLNPLKETLTGQAVSNIGTLTFSQRRWTEKKLILAILFIFKLFVIAPIKLITFPFKFMLNVVKLVTEVLLPLVTNVFAVISAYLIEGVKLLSLSLVGYKERQWSALNLLYLFPLAIVLPMASLYSVAQYALIWASRIALAITSPEKSARKAFEAGKCFLINNKREYDGNFQKWASYIMGAFGATISLAITAFSWMLLLPLALGGLVTVFPSILSAITWVAHLPFVTSSLAWLSQWPVITGSATLVNSFFGVVGGGLASVFGPAVTAMAGLISVQIPATVLTVGMTLGLIFMPVAAVASRGLDELSNLWAKWVEQAPFAALLRSKAKKVGGTEGKDIERDSSIELDGESPVEPLVGRLLSRPHIQDVTERGASQKMDKSSALYVYQPVDGGFYIASSRALYLVAKKKESEAQVDQLFEGIILRGEKAAELRDRAENVSLKGLRTQGVRFATSLEERSTRDNPVVPEGISG